MNNINVDLLTQVIGHYPLQGTIKEASPCVNGHINDTYRLSLAPESGPNQELILQRINDHVFAEPEKVMHNIQEIAAHLRQKNSAYDCDIISFMPTKDGRSCAVVNEQYWRLCHYVPNSVTYDFVDDSSLLYSAAMPSASSNPCWPICPWTAFKKPFPTFTTHVNAWAPFLPW